ncbi:MAG: imidazole glycerol phosphate synthase subunit HisH [Campylobacteraceae bacterium]|nr:imidazole glycerol phosphate synthase subunit HisH [Campylobacteraceae bacterium]
MKIVIIDYDVGNVRSMINALKKVGIEPILSNKEDDIISADGVILPGVGAFSHGMANLNKYNLVNIIKKYTNSNKPFIGICLGMQMLLDESEEFTNTKGLGLISGKVIKLPTQNINYEKLPHVSWNEIKEKKIKWTNTILNKIEQQSDMYFVHSFIANLDNENEILSTTQYSDYEFCSSIKKGNIFGCQFHPEKSGEIGLKIIKNFINICKENIK